MTATMTLHVERVNQARSVPWSPSADPSPFRMGPNMMLWTQAQIVGMSGPVVEPAPIDLGLFWLAGDRLIQPVRVLVERGSGSFVATEPQTGVFGVGPTFAAAVNDLRAALVEHLEVLRAEEALSEELDQQLAFLRSHLRP